MLDIVRDNWPLITAGFSLIAALLASGHAIIHKRNPRSAAAWTGLIWLLPIFGPGLYLTLGINRIQRKAMARRLRVRMPAQRGSDISRHPRGEQLEGAVDQVVSARRLPGHTVTLYENGDQAFPAMRQAIDEAKSTVTLCTYIFDADRAGREFVDCLSRAVERGVDVRVLVDSLGARYSVPSVVRILRKRGVKTARFGRSFWPWAMRYANLRNHRKIMVIDGRIGFIGGMNIREGNVLAWDSKHPIRDLHFCLVGPVVAQLQVVFCDDWELTTREKLDGPGWFPELELSGPVHCRCIPDGPDHPEDCIRWTMLAALACAQKRVRILTPYFVPDEGLITALGIAALRGVDVDIVLPQANNLLPVKWASDALLEQVVERGCRVHMSPAPFDHSKLMLVDDDWALVGSANWDARSLRLNFEVNVECVDKELVAKLAAIFDQRLVASDEVTMQDIRARSLPVRLRNGIFRLFSPYL